jgi:hypothetical protein
MEISTPKIRQHHCPRCGQEFTQTLFVEVISVWQPPICNSCVEASDAEAVAEVKAKANAEKQREWEAICPPLYRATDRQRLSPALLAQADGWTPGSKALAFVGAAGTGKTRTMFELLKRLHFEGRRVFAVSAVRLARASADQFSDEKEARASAKAILEQATRAEILFIDDLGKQRFTERAELDLFSLLEHRTSHLLATHWTANANSSELEKMLSADRGEPILRRLSEFSEVVKAERKA